jgi:hypothetical protein
MNPILLAALTFAFLFPNNQNKRRDNQMALDILILPAASQSGILVAYMR